MRAIVQDKYALRDLHREINLLDRKLSHIQKYEAFDSEEERAAAVRKISIRREQHVVLAQSLIDLGIEYHPSEVPISVRTPEQTALLEQLNAQANDREASAEQVAEAIAEEAAAAEAAKEPSDFGVQVARLERESGITSSPLSAWKDDLAAYRRRRSKTQQQRSA